MNFNPHSQEGSDTTIHKMERYIKISIHTPKKGVTNRSIFLFSSGIFQSTLPRREWRWYDMILYAVWGISIHTPKKGVTVHAVRIAAPFTEFQSTLPRREWHEKFLKYFYDIMISIHTPKKGVTGLATRNILRIGYFNPHSQEGSDFGLLLISPFAVKFQSTLPRREWRIVGVELEYFYKHFNPHSQEGSDAFKRGLEEYKRISIHTPKKGVTIVVIRGSTLR